MWYFQILNNLPHTKLQHIYSTLALVENEFQWHTLCQFPPKSCYYYYYCYYNLLLLLSFKSYKIHQLHNCSYKFNRFLSRKIKDVEDKTQFCFNFQESKPCTVKPCRPVSVVVRYFRWQSSNQPVPQWTVSAPLQSFLFSKHPSLSEILGHPCQMTSQYQLNLEVLADIFERGGGGNIILFPSGFFVSWNNGESDIQQMKFLTFPRKSSKAL